MLLVQQILNGLLLGGIYVGVAVAFTLTIGILNFLNFTIPVLFMLAGMVGMMGMVLMQIIRGTRRCSGSVFGCRWC